MLVHRRGRLQRRVPSWANPTRVVVYIVLPLILVFHVLVSFHPIDTQQPTSPSTTTTSSSKWAYAFLLADCDPTNPYYRGVLYNVLVATYSLKFDDQKSTTLQSRADIVLWIQMSATSNQDRLPKSEEELLDRMKIQYRYLPKPETTPTFYQLVLAKFQILEMTEYTRVLFLDGDVLPMCSLDYLLQLSEDGILEETVLHAMYDDPVNAGLWIATPGKESSTEVKRVIQNQLNQSWNPQSGWGGTSALSASSQSVDFRLWDGRNGSGWNFYCADSDQGLLLYWSRFVRKHVSIIVGDTIEQYSGSSSRYKPLSSHDFFAQHSCLPPVTRGSDRRETFAQNYNTKAATLPFYQDFYHMVGYSKAWERPLRRPVPSEKEQLESSHEYWYFLLRRVVERFDTKQIIPPLDQVSYSVGKPKIRGDLFAVANGT